MIQVRTHGKSVRGQVRRRNEDHFLIGRLSKRLVIDDTNLSAESFRALTDHLEGIILLVADGVGGSGDGQRASELAVQQLAEYVTTTMPWFLDSQGAVKGDSLDELKQGLLASHQRVLDAAADDAMRSNMSTTLTVAVICGLNLHVVHAGDSRCYLFRDGRPMQLTEDHTLAHQLVSDGVMSEEEAKSSRFSHMLTRSVGGGGGAESPEPQLFSCRLRSGDCLMLCSDGLTGELDDRQIADLAQRHEAPEVLCQNLVEAADAAGGHDNITVAVARVEHLVDGVETPAQAATEAVLADDGQSVDVVDLERTVVLPQPVDAIAEADLADGTRTVKLPRPVEPKDPR